MHKNLSLYLDAMRFLMAVLVFLAHLAGFTDGFLWQLSHLGHQAVVFFFVLSGFVIAYVVLGRHENAKKYLINRSLRIYSVAIPSLIITVFLYYLGQSINPDLFAPLELQLQTPLINFFSAIIFLNQSWQSKIVFSNLPYWSLAYEVFYYVFFACLIYLSGFKRVLMIVLVSILMGPSILLYLPIWLLGVGSFIFINRYCLTIKSAFFLFIVSLTAIVFLSFQKNISIINEYGLELFGANFYAWLLEPAEMFLSDMIFSIVIAVHIVTISVLLNGVKEVDVGIAKVIQHFSGLSFALYLLHMPILYFFEALFPPKNQPILNLLACLVVTPVIIYFIAIRLENYRIYFKNKFNEIKSH